MCPTRASPIGVTTFATPGPVVARGDPNAFRGPCRADRGEAGRLLVAHEHVLHVLGLRDRLVERQSGHPAARRSVLPYSRERVHYVVRAGSRHGRAVSP